MVMLPPRSIYGLGLQVNVPLAGLRGAPEAARSDIMLIIGEMPMALDEAWLRRREVFYVSDEIENNAPAMTASRLDDGAFYSLDYADGTRVAIDARAERIWAAGPPEATIEDTAAYLLGPVLGFALRLRGSTCLHASAVAIGGRAVAFVGAGGAGKSTLAAAFARRGEAVLTDDVAPLIDHGHRFEVQPAYPRIRLWPESVEALFGARDALPRITPTWDKRYLGLDGARYRFASTPLPLAAVFLLAARGHVDAPRIEPLSQRQSLLCLVRDTYTARLLNRELRAREFEVLGRVVATVPVFRIVASDDPGRIDALCEMIECHVATADIPAA